MGSIPYLLSPKLLLKNVGLPLVLYPKLHCHYLFSRLEAFHSKLFPMGVMKDPFLLHWFSEHIWSPGHEQASASLCCLLILSLSHYSFLSLPPLIPSPAISLLLPLCPRLENIQNWTIVLCLELISCNISPFHVSMYVGVIIVQVLFIQSYCWKFM